MRTAIQASDEPSQLRHTRPRVNANAEMRDFAVNLSRPFRVWENVMKAATSDICAHIYIMLLYVSARLCAPVYAPVCKYLIKAAPTTAAYALVAGYVHARIYAACGGG